MPVVWWVARRWNTLGWNEMPHRIQSTLQADGNISRLCRQYDIQMYSNSSQVTNFTSRNNPYTLLCIYWIT